MVLAFLIIAFWVLILTGVAGLCLSARQGDLQQRQGASVHLASDPIAAPVISAPIAAQQSGRRVYSCDPLGLTGSAAG